MLNDKNPEIEFKRPSRAGAIFGVLLVLASLAGYVFFTKDLASIVSKEQADLIAKQAEVSTLQVKLSDLQQAEKDFALTSQVEKFEILKSVPTEMDQDEVIRNLIGIARNYDITLHSIGFGKASTPQDGVSSLQISASFEGNYNDLLSFLEGLEQNARMLKVDSISVQVNTLEVSNIKRATFSLTMQAFYQDKSN